jgi:hypothetical protein
VRGASGMTARLDSLHDHEITTRIRRRKRAVQ